MKVFVSWSGNRSRAVAELLSDWIKCVIQATKPWISTRDIDRGALWFSEISDQLQDTTVGIICLTHENKNKPWILFEAGALAKGLTSNRVCTFLIDLKPSDIEDPLAQFNHTLPDKHGLWELVRTLNSGLVKDALDERILDQIFETYWPQFEQKFEHAISHNPPVIKPEPRSEANLLAEILDNTRFLSSKIRHLELQFESNNFENKKLPPNAVEYEQLLSEREHRMLTMMNEGLSYEEIAGRLGISINSLKYFAYSLKKKQKTAKERADMTQSQPS